MHLQEDFIRSSMVLSRAALPRPAILVKKSAHSATNHPAALTEFSVVTIQLSLVTL